MNDECRNRAKRRKHGIGFEEAVSAFFDPDAADRRATARERAFYLGIKPWEKSTT